MTNKIFEAKNLNVFKKLLRILAEYIKDVPEIGTRNYFNAAVKQGIKILPKDKTALAILDSVLDEDAVLESLQKLLNMRFSNCPVDCRPLNKNSEKYEVAFWTIGNSIKDKVGDLIDWEGSGVSGKWTDAEGKAVLLVDMSKENK